MTQRLAHDICAYYSPSFIFNSIEILFFYFFSIIITVAVVVEYLEFNWIKYQLIDIMNIIYGRRIFKILLSVICVWCFKGLIFDLLYMCIINKEINIYVFVEVLNYDANIAVFIFIQKFIKQ